MPDQIRSYHRAFSGELLMHRRPERYGDPVQTVGGLKLALEPATHLDRRARFAQVKLSDATGRTDVLLVTDSRGRMRYRLPDGEYRLRLVDGQEAGFSVRDHRWTTVRVKLT